MLTLGIDPGTSLTGFGVIEESNNKLKLIDCGCINTTKIKSKEKKLLIIFQQLEKLLEKFSPKYVAVEKLFFSKNVKTALAVGEARGISLLLAAKNRIELAEYTPSEVKLAITGYGKATKNQIQYMVKNILGLKDVPKPDDVADALAIAICHLHSYRLKYK
jgi:crossover junction endodeoxyribonuclease RuvC